jgi:hypothetical protein
MGVARSYDPDSGAATALLSPASTFQTSRAGTVLLEGAGPTPALSVVPVAGGAPVAVGTASGTVIFAGDGSAVVYVGAGGSIVRAPSDGSAATTLVASGAARIDALSPDGNWLVYSISSSGSPTRFDSYFSSATTMQPPVKLTTEVQLVQFTDDNRWVVYRAPCFNSGSHCGNLFALSVAGGASINLGPSTYTWGVANPGGARLVWPDSEPTSSGLPLANILFVDLAAGSTPQTLLTIPGPWGVFGAVSADNKRVFYRPGGCYPGIYSIPLP